MRAMRLQSRRLVAAVLIGLLIGQPALGVTVIEADAEAEAGQRPEVDEAANGVAVVQIAAANEAGLSHNRYVRFDVDSSGAILNNSTEELSQSQLGGLIQGNGNLSESGSALVILNEVRSTDRTELRGAVEVHGVAAEVIVANPNGLWCDGCGFINTAQVTLAAGVAELGEGGELQSLRSGGGELGIGAGGAELSSSQVFNLLAGRMSVAGAVSSGGVLNVVAGPARVGYADGVITALEASGGEAAEWAIDTGLLGGMYGQRIRIVATEAGAGVRLRGPLAASTAGIEVSGDGRVELREARAATTLEAESAAEAVAVGGALYAEESVELIGHTAVELGAGAYVGSGGEVELTAQTVRLGSGALAAAGVDSFEPSTGGVLRVSAELQQARGHWVPASGWR